MKNKKLKIYQVYCAALGDFVTTLNHDGGEIIKDFESIKDAEDYIRADAWTDIMESDCAINETEGFYDTYTIYEIVKVVRPEAKVEVNIVLKNEK